MGSRFLSTMMALTAALAATPALGQGTAGLAGHWTGTISEPRSRNHPQYTLSVHIDLDRNGQPVGEVHYEAFPCSGIWAGAQPMGAGWRFDETITNGRAHCAHHVVIELMPGDGALNVRLWPVGMENEPGSGRLLRRN